jgi:hypothetical protein
MEREFNQFDGFRSTSYSIGRVGPSKTCVSTGVNRALGVLHQKDPRFIPVRILDRKQEIVMTAVEFVLIARIPSKRSETAIYRYIFVVSIIVTVFE